MMMTMMMVMVVMMMMMEPKTIVYLMIKNIYIYIEDGEPSCSNKHVADLLDNIQSNTHCVFNLDDIDAYYKLVWPKEPTDCSVPVPRSHRNLVDKLLIP